MKTLRLRTGTSILATLVATLLVLPATAQACRGGGPPGPDRCIARHAGELGLDDATVAQIDAIVAASREAAAPLRDAVRAARAEMRALLDADEPDEAAVMAQSDRVSAALAALHKHRLATLLKIRALLTPEQRGKLRAMCGPGRHTGLGGAPGAWMGPAGDGGPPCGGADAPCGAAGPPCGGPPSGAGLP